MMKKRRRFIIVLAVLLPIAVYLAVGLYRGLRVTEFEYENDKIPKEFDGYTIVQISDLHCAEFGEEQSKLIESIKNESPDLIVITGDMFDKKRWNYVSMQNLLAGISGLAPIYAITGNNEYDDQAMYGALTELYADYGVVLLQDETVEITRGEASIYLCGMYYRNYVSQQNFDLMGEKNQFNIVLYHDPSQFERIGKNGFDLMLAGHTHGGIVRPPFVGGVIGNDGGFFPPYDYGMYETDVCDMYVSTGLGDLEIPRFYNRPEIAVITLRAR